MENHLNVLLSFYQYCFLFPPKDTVNIFLKFIKIIKVTLVLSIMFFLLVHLETSQISKTSSNPKRVSLHCDETQAAGQQAQAWAELSTLEARGFLGISLHPILQFPLFCNSHGVYCVVRQ